MILFDAKIISGIFSVLLLCAITIVVDLICMSIMNLLGWDNSQIMVDGFRRSVYIVFAKIVYLIGILAASGLLKRKGAPIGLFQIIPLLPCQLFSIYFCDSLYRSPAYDQSGYTALLILIGLLYINIIVVVFAEAIRLREDAKHQSELATQQYEMQRRYYERLYQEQENTRALWHDINKYMIAMRSMVKTENQHDASEVLETVQEKFNQVGTVVDTNNPVLNSILNYYIQNAHASGVQIELDVWVAEKLGIKAADLSVIIGNTFDNAIEACTHMADPLKEICVVISQKQNVLLYEIRNPYSPSAPPKSGSCHGYGLQNVKACVEKYEGTVYVENKDNVYSVSIRLNTKEL